MDRLGFALTRSTRIIPRSMKIGFSTFVMQGGRSGVATYVRNLLRFLQEEDAENTYDLLMARSEADLVPLTNPNFKKCLYSPFISHPVANLAWHNLGLTYTKTEDYEKAIEAFERVLTIIPENTNSGNS